MNIGASDRMLLKMVERKIPSGLSARISLAEVFAEFIAATLNGFFCEGASVDIVETGKNLCH